MVFNIANNGDVNISGKYKINNRDIDANISNYVLSTSNTLVDRTRTEVVFGSNYSVRLDSNASNYVLSTSNTLVDRTRTEVVFGSNYSVRLDSNASNYVLSTSNILIDAIKNNKSSQWTTSNNNIYYNTYNVGIGTAVPSNKLHIYDDISNETKLIIQNKYVSGAITSSPAQTLEFNNNYTYQVFTYTTDTAGVGTGQTQYTLNASAGGVVCDILIVGGGGGGAKTDAGGGGAGGLIYIQNITLTGNYTINVGKRGLGGASASLVAIVGGKGTNSSFIGTNANYVAYGGGGGGYGYPSDVEPGNLGPYGSSGGLGTSDITRESFNVNTVGQGYLGGLGTASTGGGGGGGSGGPGENSGNGGIGTQINITGSNLYYAGGGGGGHTTNGTSGGLGGGGSATFTDGNNATFYGGGGGGGGGNWGNGGNGFEGVVIIRYLSPSTSSSIDLIRGVIIDGAIDYSVGNYDGDFKVKSSVSGTPTDRLTINSSGNVTIGGNVTATSFIGDGRGLSGVLLTSNDANISNYVLSTSNTLVTRIGLKQDTLTSLNTIGVFNTSHFTNNTGTNKIDITASSLSKWTNNSVDATKIYYNGGNVGIGTTNPSNILQVGGSGRLRIANNNTDFTMIGSADIDGSTNTTIVLSGTDRASYNGQIDYVARSTGSHIFYTTASATERMRITSAGNVGIGTTDPAGYMLNVNGSQFINNQLKFSDRYTDVDNFPCNKITLYNNGFGFGISNSTLDYFSPVNHRFYTGSSSTLFGTERMKIYNNGTVAIQSSSGFAGNMSAGSLVIGNNTDNYGGGTTSWNANTAGLLMECLENTEIAVHDSGNSIHSFMRYTTNGNFRIGRDMGHGLANTTIAGTLTCDGTSTLTGRVGIGKAPHATFACDVNGNINATSYLLNGSDLLGTKQDNLTSLNTIGVFNTSHFTNNTGTNKIDITSSSLSKWTNNSVDATKIYYNGGNVGIGTTDPSTYKLNVNGSINSSSYTLNGVPLNIGALSQGMTVQTKHLTYTQMDVKNNTGWDAINDDLVNGFVIAITPASASSKILVNMIAHIGTDPNGDNRWWGIKLYRKIGAGGAWTEVTGANGTETGAAANTAGTPVWVSHNLGMDGTTVYGYLIANLTGTYLDAPNTTSIVYYTAYWNQRIGDNPSASGFIWLNRAYRQFDDAWRPAPSSSWTATEIWDLGTPYVPPSGDTTITIASSSVGVGATPNANHKLIVNQGTSGSTGVTCFPLKISAGAFTNAGNSTATLIGLGTENNGSLTKCAIGHSRTGTYDVGSIVFLCNNTVDSSQVSMANEKMRIASDGNVGIGTNNPATILEVVSPSPIFTLRSSDNGSGKIYFGNSSHGVGRNAGISTLTGGNDVTLWTAGDGSVGFVTNGIERMRIASNGNVGIGTTNSANGIYSILHIKGTDPIFTIQGQGGLGAKSQINLSTYDTSTTNASGCSLIATDDGAYGSTFQINLKTSGANTNTQFTALQINNTGNVGISKTSHATYKLDVNGSVNATSFAVGGAAFTSSQWVGTTDIYNITGNVGIGTSTTPINLLELTKATYTGAILSIDAGIANAGAGVMSQAIGKPLLRLGRGFYSATVGDYYGIGFGYAPLALSNSCCEIGVKISSTTGNEIGDIVLSTRAGTTDIPATERMRITSAGNVGIGTNNPTSGALTIYGTTLGRNNSLYIQSPQSGIMLDSTLNGVAGTKKYNIWSTTTADSAGAGAFAIYDETGSAYRMVIGSSGNVSIGATDTATYKLNVNGSLNATSFAVGGAAFTSSQWVGTTDIYNITGNVGIGTSTVNERLTIRGAGARLMMLTCATATYASYMGFSNSANDSLAYIGVDGVGLNGLVYGALTLGTWKDQPILFTTGATNTEKMRIASGGNVGIGTNNPLALLDVVYSPPAVANTDMLNIRVDANWGLKVQQSYTVAGNIQYNLIHRYNTVDYNSLTFKGAFVGVGTNSPTNKLHIVHSSTAANPTGTGGIGLYVYNPTNTAGNNSVITNRIGGSSAGKVLYGFDVDTAYGFSIYMLGSSSDLRFNNNWEGAGTDVMRLANNGNVAIGTSPHATYKLDVNGTINATSVLVGGAAISGSKWTAGATATNIYYASGNVGIGTSATSDADDNATFAIPTATLFVKGGASAAGTCDVVIRGGLAGQEQGKAKLWLMSDASHSSYIQSQHTGSGNTQLTFGTSSGNALPTERMVINTSGNVGIGHTNPLYRCHIKMSYSDAATGLHLDAGEANTDTNKYTLTIWPYVIGGGEIGWKFRTQNYTGGIHTPLTINNYGNVVVAGNLNTASLTCTGDTAVNGNLYVGTSGAASTIFLGGGAAGDNDFNMSTIASRNYSGTENTEIIIFKGNDVGTTTTADRIRLRAGAIVFDTFPGASSDRTAENIRMVIDGSGNVGIGNTAPLGPLHIADGNQANNDGHIILARCTTVGSTRMTRIGFNSSFQFCIGDVGGGNTLSAWTQSFKMDYTAPANSVYIDSSGNLSVLANVSAYVSDMRLKTKTANIKEPLEIINKLTGFYYTLNDVAKSYGFKNNKQEIGLSAQDVESVLPELVSIAPFDKKTDDKGNESSKSGETYLTVSYDRLAPVLVEAIKELNQKNIALTKENDELKDKYNKLLEDITLIKQTLNLI